MSPFLKNASRMEVMKLAATYDVVKTAGIGSHAVEVAGLGILARPSLRAMKGKEQDEKSTHRHEVAGLGLLAAPSAGHIGSAALKKVNPVAHSRIAATKAGKFLSKFAASNGFGQFAGRAAHLAQGAVKPVAKAVAPIGKAVAEAPKKKLTMDMIQAAKKNMAKGGHGGIY